MKKSALLSLLFLILLPSLSADVVSYTGGGAEIPTSSLSIDYSIDSEQGLTESGSVKEMFFYGFYTGEPDMDSNTGKLVFKENAVGTTTTGVKYKADAGFSLYLFVLSNNSYTYSLEWTDLTNSGSKISYTVDGNDSGYNFCTFNPGNGIFFHDNFDFTAETGVYEIATGTESKEYTGTMTLKMTTGN